MNRNINKTPVIITDPSQFDTLKPWRPYKFVCKSCRKEIVIFSFTPKSIDKAKMMMCGPCRSSYIQKNKSPEEKSKIVLGRKSTLKERYGDENYNNHETAAKTNIERYGSSSPLGNPEIYARTQQTMLNNYGVTSYVKTKEFKRQKIETQLKLYGDPNYTNREKADKTFKNNHDGISLAEYSKTQEAKDKVAKTNNERYGGPSPMCSEEVRLKSQQTKEELYNDPFFVNVEKIEKTKTERYKDPYYNNPEKQKETVHNKYGEEFDYVFQVPEIQELKTQKMIEIYGVPYPMQNPEFFEKSKKTKMEKHGNPYYTNREQARETNIKRHGQTGGFSHKYNYYGVLFDSSWELAVWIYCIDHNIPIVRSPFIYEYDDNGKVRNYYLDFWINGELIEIKGDQFKKDDNTFESPYVENKEKTDLENKRKCMIKNNIKILYESNMKPYLDYVKLKYGYYFYKPYIISNPFNPSYSSPNGYIPIVKPYYLMNLYYSAPVLPNKGLTPYDCDMKEKYTPIIGKGITPFDIGLVNISSTLVKM